MNGGGDTLARGGKSFTFGPAQGITQERWDAIWAEDAEVIHETNDKNLSQPPPHCGTKIRLVETYN